MKKFTLFVILLITIFSLRGNAQNNISKRPTNGNALAVSVDTKDASESGSNDGSIKLKVSGGQAPYTIHCFGPYSLPTQTVENELKLEDIKSGDYLFVVQDKLMKSVVKEIKISNLK
jgi:hypothetical protein